MTSPLQLPTDSDADDLSRLSRWAGLALLGLFTLGVGTSLLPPALLSPPWQMQQIQLLLQQGPMALIGLALLRIGGHLRGEKTSKRRAALAQRMALAVALGYALLIPLQLYANWSQWKLVSGRDAINREQLRSRLESLDRQVGRATDDAQLRRLLQQLPVTAPSLEQLGADPSARRRGARELLGRLSDELALEIRRLEDARGQELFRSSVRNVLAALLLTLTWLMVAAPRPRFWLPWRSDRQASPQRGGSGHLEDLFDPGLTPVETGSRDRSPEGA